VTTGCFAVLVVGAATTAAVATSRPERREVKERMVLEFVRELIGKE